MRILIAEDDPTSRKVLTRMLESERCYEIVTTCDGAEAWAALERGPAFGLCLFDIMMPEIDGLTLLERLRSDSRFASQCVILCTARNERSIITQAAALGVKAYIVKPYNREKVQSQVNRIYESNSSEIHFEPISRVAARLEVVEARVPAFQSDFQIQVDDMLGMFRVNDRLAAYASLLRISALKETAVKLGVRVLADQLAALEKCCASSFAGDYEPILAEMEREQRRLERILRPPAPVVVVEPVAVAEPVVGAEPFAETAAAAEAAAVSAAPGEAAKATKPQEEVSIPIEAEN